MPRSAAYGAVKKLRQHGSAASRVAITGAAADTTRRIEQLRIRSHRRRPAGGSGSLRGSSRATRRSTRSEARARRQEGRRRRLLRLSARTGFGLKVSPSRRPPPSSERTIPPICVTGHARSRRTRLHMRTRGAARGQEHMVAPWSSATSRRARAVSVVIVVGRGRTRRKSLGRERRSSPRSDPENDWALATPRPVVDHEIRRPEGGLETAQRLATRPPRCPSGRSRPTMGPGHQQTREAAARGRPGNEICEPRRKAWTKSDTIARRPRRAVMPVPMRAISGSSGLREPSCIGPSCRESPRFTRGRPGSGRPSLDTSAGQPSSTRQSTDETRSRCGGAPLVRDAPGGHGAASSRFWSRQRTRAAISNGMPIPTR